MEEADDFIERKREDGRISRARVRDVPEQLASESTNVILEAVGILDVEEV